MAKPVPKSQADRIISELKALLAESGPHALRWYRRIGELVSQLHPRGGRTYGDFGDFLAELAPSFATNASSHGSKLMTLRSLLDMCCLLPSAYSLTELHALENPPAGTHRLGWTHLRFLLRLSSPERAQTQEAAIQGKWSARRLRDEIQRTHGNRGVGGRKPQAAADPEQALQQLIRESMTWLRKAKQVWYGAEASPVFPNNVGTRRTNPPALLQEADEVLAEMQDQILEMRRTLYATPSRRTSKKRARSSAE